MSRIPLLAILSVVLVTSACSTRLNPFNWFGKDEEKVVVVQQVAPGGVIDPRPYVDQVTSLRVDRAPGGAIINVVGLNPVQGYWEAALLAENNQRPVDGVLTFQFRASKPVTRTGQGPDRSREITAAVFLTEQEMAGVRSIVVQAAQNQRSVRR